MTVAHARGPLSRGHGCDAYRLWARRLATGDGDCHDLEVIGYEFALTTRAKEAERGVEATCLARFGRVRPLGALVLRSDNGLIFRIPRFTILRLLSVAWRSR